nr:MAG TPA: hypothetical protein [Caudoviricetes sp.]
MFTLRCMAGTWYLNGTEMESLRSALEVVFNTLK